MNTSSRTFSNKSVYSKEKPAMPATKLIAFENEYHRHIDALLREVKRLRREVGMLAKRYNGSKKEIKELVERVSNQPPPPIPARKREAEEVKVDEEKRQLRTSSPTPLPDRYTEQVRQGAKAEETITPCPQTTSTVQANTTVQSPIPNTTPVREMRITNDINMWQEWRNAGPRSRKKSMFTGRGRFLHLSEGVKSSYGETKFGDHVKKMWLMGPEKEEGQYGFVDVRMECFRTGECERTKMCGKKGKRCKWGHKWITKRLVWTSGEMLLREQKEDEESDERNEETEVPWSVYGEDSD